MIRTTAAGSALLLLPLLLLPLEGQALQVSAADRTHTVQPGETLSGIAQRYLGSGAQWTRLLEANRERISNPDRIQPGVTLVIPGAAQAGGIAGAPQPTTVFGVQVAGQAGITGQTTLIGGLPYEERRALLRVRPFEPEATPETPIDRRTVFYDARAADELIRVILQPPEAVPALPAAVFHTAGWLAPEEAASERLGEIVGFAGAQDVRFGRTTIHPYDEVRIRFFAEGSARVGDEFMIYGIERSIPGVGRVAVPSGRVRVIAIGDAEVIAQVIQEYDRMQLGQNVTRVRTFPLVAGVHPTETGLHLEARLLAFQERKELHLPGDFAFLDRGRVHGLAVGDELVGFGVDEHGRSGRGVARFQVVGVQDQTATVRIVSTEAPGALLPGLAIVLDRKMP